ncbi:hypothetical protein C8F00_0684 [Xanthomonas vasicola]
MATGADVRVSRPQYDGPEPDPSQCDDAQRPVQDIADRGAMARMSSSRYLGRRERGIVDLASGISAV